jgi:hypothetical protein
VSQSFKTFVANSIGTGIYEEGIIDKIPDTDTNAKLSSSPNKKGINTPN